MTKGVYEVQTIDRATGKECWVRIIASGREEALTEVSGLGEIVGGVRLVEVASSDSTSEARAIDHHGAQSRPERVLLTVRPSFWAGSPAAILAGVLLLPAFGIGIIIFVYLAHHCLSTRLVVTNQRSTLRTGLLWKHMSEVEHEHIRHVEALQDPIQRIFGSGSLGLSSAGGAGMELVISGIPDVFRVKATIDGARHPRDSIG